MPCQSCGREPGELAYDLAPHLDTILKATGVSPEQLAFDLTPRHQRHRKSYRSVAAPFDIDVITILKLRAHVP